MYDGKNINPELRLRRYVRITLLILGIISLLIIPFFLITFYSFYNKERLDPDFSMLREGKLGWFLPKTFIQGNTDRVKILLSYDLGYEQNLIIESEGNKKRPELIDTIKTSQVMAFELISSKKEGEPHFLIQPSGFQEQIIDTSRFSKSYWEWSVTALKGGNATLTLNKKLRIPTTEGLIDNIQPSQSKSVVIENRISYQVNQFISKNWAWLMSAIIIPIWIFFFNKFRNAVKEKRNVKNRLKKEISRIEFDKVSKLKATVEALISKDELEESIKKIIDFTNLNQVEELRTQIVRISATFKSNEKEYLMNTISNSDYNINKSRLTKGLLELMKDVSEYSTQQSA